MTRREIWLMIGALVFLVLWTAGDRPSVVSPEFRFYLLGWAVWIGIAYRKFRAWRKARRGAMGGR